MSDTTLVTGGAGYVGSILVAELLAEGRRVRVLDSLRHGSIPSLLSLWGHPGLEFVRGDVRDSDVLDTVLHGAPSVVHLAAIVGDPACARDPEEARSVNLEATRTLARRAREAGAERFIFASTCSNYGKLDGSALATEAWELRPVSLYAETKVQAELDVLELSANGLATCCLRLATVYGTSPRMRFDLTVNEFARDVALGRELTVYGEQFWRPYVHVRDAARAIQLALRSPVELVRGEVFNAGATSENYRKVDIVELLRERYPTARIRFVARDEDPRDYRVSFAHIEAVLGFSTTSTVADGIDEVAALVSSGLIADPFGDAYCN